MNPIRWLATRLTGYAIKARSPLAFVAAYLSNMLWLIDTTWHALIKQGYGQNSAVYSCIRTLSQGVAEPHIKCYTDADDPEERTELPPTHDLVKLIRRPNELLTEYEMNELLTIHVSVVGRSVWWKERSVSGKPIALWPLRPDRVGPVYADPNETRDGQRVVAGYAYLPPDGTTPILIPRRDTFSVNFPDPDGESGGLVEGFGPLCAIAREVGADNSATTYVGSLLANYAQPGIALEMLDGPASEEEANLIKSKFRQEFGGTRIGTPAIVGAGTKIVPLGFNLQQLEFPALRDNAEARICAAFGVPAVLAGLRVGLAESQQNATIDNLRQDFTERTLSSYWRRYQDQFTLELASEFDEDIVCEYDMGEVKALATQRERAIAPIREAFAAGAATRNQYLKAVGLPLLPPEIGDVLQVPANVTEVPTSPAAQAAIEKKQQQAMEQQRQLIEAKKPLALPPGKEPEDEEAEEEEQAIKYYPGQPRDEIGQFAAADGTGGGSAAPTTSLDVAGIGKNTPTALRKRADVFNQAFGRSNVAKNVGARAEILPDGRLEYSRDARSALGETYRIRMTYRDALNMLWGQDMRAIHQAMQSKKAANLQDVAGIVVIPIDDELAEVLETNGDGLKHLPGQHNQQRHAWRYGSHATGGEREFRKRILDDTEREQYDMRAFMRGDGASILTKDVVNRVKQIETTTPAGQYSGFMPVGGDYVSPQIVAKFGGTGWGGPFQQGDAIRKLQLAGSLQVWHELPGRGKAFSSVAEIISGGNAAWSSVAAANRAIGNFAPIGQYLSSKTGPDRRRAERILTTTLTAMAFRGWKPPRASKSAAIKVDGPEDEMTEEEWEMVEEILAALDALEKKRNQALAEIAASTRKIDRALEDEG